MKPDKPHDSQRGYFAWHLYDIMQTNKDVWLITGDLGYKMFDAHFNDFPNRCINTGAAEVGMMDIAVGLALADKIPFVYSITPFLLARPYEVIRNYINKEKIAVKLVGSGRDKDYVHDGFSHDASDASDILSCFGNVIEYWPESKEQIKRIVYEMADNKMPSFISLKR